MKKVLITGANSYIGCSFDAYIKEHYPQEFSVDTVDMIDGSWKERDFSGYDVVFHVAGIVHQKKGAVSDEIYDKVNCDLVIDVAKKAKEAGVRQFVFLSTMSVYGKTIGYIDENTLPEPVNAYGKSKLRAEKYLEELKSESFLVSIVRPPMIYGKGCKGNFVSLANLADKTPIFPNVKNERSMLYINNLNLFLYYVITKELEGILLPQDKEFVCTWDIVRLLNKEKNQSVIGVGVLNPLLRFFAKHIGIFGKVFGNLCYKKSVSELVGIDYQKYTLEEAIHEIVH